MVDDDPTIADLVSGTLSVHGYRVSSYTDSEVAMEALVREGFDLALIDVNMPVVDGIDLSRRILDYDPETEIIIIGVPDENNLDPYLEMGLTHFLFKPFNESQLVYTVYAALHFKRLRRVSLETDLKKTKGSNLVGVSISVRDIRREIEMMAGTDLAVLIVGESGTGKEIIARDLHLNSGRSSQPFLPINCAMLGSLADSELFGHARGAFTGAGKSTEGYIGAACGGTLFFDEVGDLSNEIQAKLLRFLDSGEYSKVGETRIRHADIRVVAATNQDLKKMCAMGAFRADLYYRLSGTIIRTEPLRERKVDIIPLVWHFLSVFGAKKNITYCISADACSRLLEEEWPGNVRQLKQTLYKICQVADTRKISLVNVLRVLGGNEVRHRSYREAKQQILEEFDREYFLKILYLAKGSLKKALQLSGMHKKNFYVKIKKHGFSVKEYERFSDS